MKLTIGVVTMNRAQQLKCALESYLRCKLPDKTEFIIIDNASTDETEQIVREILDECGYTYKYQKLENNIGAGAGRNLYFELATGEYIYGGDDDAFVDSIEDPDFFIKALDILDKNEKIATLATQIYDLAWADNRIKFCGPQISEEIYKCKMFCGGSHFLRKKCFEKAPYFPNKYGYEELPPSLKAADSGKFNAFCPSLIVIHNPKINKWDYQKEENKELLVRECAVPYAIKVMMYPQIIKPILFVFYKKRCNKYLKKNNLKRKANKLVVETKTLYKIEYRIKLKTLCKMFADFGISIF